MEIFNIKDKRDLLEALEGVRRGIPVMDMDDRDFTAAVLYRMAEIVREHGPSHGINLDRPNAYERFFVAGRMNGKTAYNAELLAALREDVARKKAVAGLKITEADIKRVIYNPPATIIYWKDGSKTVVKCSDKDFDEGRMSPETGLVYAIAKKVLGNKGNYNDVLRRLVKGVSKED